MIRVGDRVFAVHQKNGLLVINAVTDEVETVISAPKDGSKQRGFGSIVLSKDGNLWISVATNTSGSGGAEDYLIKLNPYTLETERIELPKGMSVPNSWYAWTADGFCASTVNNKLYWKNNGGWKNSTLIYEFDIDNNTVKPVVDLSTHESEQGWGIYGAGFRLDPRTDDIYVSLFKAFGDPTYKVACINTQTGVVSASYPMESHYWFPAMPVFPDIHAPVVSDLLTGFNVSSTHSVYLGDMVSDDDNLSAAIVKSIQSVEGTGVVAEIKDDYLVVTPVSESEGSTIINLMFNSNGKTVAKSISVGVDNLLVESIHLSESEITVDAGSSYQLTAVIKPDYATNKNVTWSSSDNDIAKVSDSGLVSGVAVGEATITATTQDGGLMATCIVKVVGTSTGVDNGTVDSNSIHFEKATGLVVIN